MSSEHTGSRINIDLSGGLRSSDGRSTQSGPNPPAEVPREDYHRLLQTLDPDPVQAAEKYEKLRQKLIVFFDRHGWPEADIMADETIGRTARKIGVDAIENMGNYTLEVARRLHLESIRKRERNPVKGGDFEDVLRTSETRMAAPSTSFGVPDETVIAEIRMQCLDRCMKRLSKADRRLLLAWYSEEGRVKLELRQQLASDIGISMSALKTRLCRLRQGLVGCCADCIEKALAAWQRF